MNFTPLGPEFPEKIEDELAWKGAYLEANPDLFTEYLTGSDTAEIDAAIKHFKSTKNSTVHSFQLLIRVSGQGVARGLANPNTFPLSQALAKRLRSVADYVYNGRGFHRIKGFEPSRYTEEDRVIAYAGITSYVADQRARNIGKTTPPMPMLAFLIVSKDIMLTYTYRMYQITFAIVP